MNKESPAMRLLLPKLSDFLLDLRRSLAHKGFAKNRST
jgi:hypothetical protein